MEQPKKEQVVAPKLAKQDSVPTEAELKLKEEKALAKKKLIEEIK